MQSTKCNRIMCIQYKEQNVINRVHNIQNTASSFRLGLWLAFWLRSVTGCVLLCRKFGGIAFWQKNAREIRKHDTSLNEKSTCSQACTQGGYDHSFMGASPSTREIKLNKIMPTDTWHRQQVISSRLILIYPANFAQYKANPKHVAKDVRYSRIDWLTNSHSASASGLFLFIYPGRGRSRAEGNTSADAYVFNVTLHNFDMS